MELGLLRAVIHPHVCAGNWTIVLWKNHWAIFPAPNLVWIFRTGRLDSRSSHGSISCSGDFEISTYGSRNSPISWELLLVVRKAEVRCQCHLQIIQKEAEGLCHSRSSQSKSAGASSNTWGFWLQVQCYFCGTASHLLLRLIPKK